MQKPAYQNTNKSDSRKIAEFLSKDGQLLLPFLELICNTEQAVDELIDRLAVPPAIHIGFTKTKGPLGEYALEYPLVVYLHVPGPDSVNPNICPAQNFCYAFFC